MVDHIFKTDLGPAYGLGSDDDDDSNDKRGTLTHGEQSVPYTLRFWSSPDGHELLIALTFRCPKCNFPLLVPATQAGISKSDEAGLTMRTPAVCPAHWEAVNDQGQTLGHRVKCGWSGVIRDDELHERSCPVSNFTQHRDYVMCNCQPKEGA